MGNLGEKNELTAMKAAGVSLLRVMRPLLFVMVLLAGISFYFSNYVWGKAYLSKKILITDMTNKKLALVLKEGVFFNEIDNYSIRANKIDKVSNEMKDVLIFQHNLLTTPCIFFSTLYRLAHSCSIKFRRLTPEPFAHGRFDLIVILFRCQDV